MSLAAAARLDPAAYDELVARVRGAVASAVPAGSAVLVLSKGDASLLALPGLTASHFPQDSASGGYAGYHPRDSADAIAQLEELRRRGAEFLVVPATSRWWLAHYGAFAEHLANRARLVSDDERSCLIFDLGRRIGAEGACGKPSDPPQTSIAQMRAYLQHLLPADCRIAVLDRPPGIAGELAPLHAVGLEPGVLEHAGEGKPPLRALRDGGCAFLVVPRDADGWLSRHVDAAAALEGLGAKIADQRHICRVYDLSGWSRP